MSQALFPGWRPDADGRERLATVADAIAAARPGDAPKPQRRRPDQWHATLCFLGYDLRHVVTPTLLDAFADAAARIPPHAFTLERVAYWRQSGAVVALPRSCDALQALCDATRDAAKRCGIRPKQVTTQPHVTLAYLDRGLDGQAWLEAVDCAGASLRVDGFELLFNPGGSYEALAAWPLTGTSLPAAPRQASLL
ncbi:MAG TPA: 2'-5' RNA ligase family protein [Luteimonas sp.]|nr:2'-5' RNA ligase family protein [Luteimonas sp.]HRP72665.1 2'-5' RNA ligase family protein [Luteimonas sp.]